MRSIKKSLGVGTAHCACLLARQAVLVWAFLGLVSLSFADNTPLPPLAENGEETLTIETFYPSPWGEYETLHTDKLVLNPLSAEPGLSDSKKGMLYYDDTPGVQKPKYYDGATWKELGGSSLITWDNLISCNTGNQGLIRYNNTNEKVEFCDGVDWLPIFARECVADMDLVACNSKTEPDYYWKVGAQISRYGFSGMGNNGVEPACNASTLGTQAETAAWQSSAAWWLVYTNWYPKDGDYLCSPHCGSFRVTCTKR